MEKVILILCDGLRYDTAKDGMGFLGHLVETKQANLYKIIGEIPSMSRPVYETIHTGLSASAHGVVANHVVRPSNQPNIFSLAQKAGKVTAASAYSWFSELYNRVPYHFILDKEVDNDSLPIQHGRFYTQDDTPDIETFSTGAMLAHKFSPDYLLIHLMGMDFIGEKYGSDSSEYRNHAIHQDAMMAPMIEEWRSNGYQIIVTSDHGMNYDKAHGGTTGEVREVPFYYIQSEKNQKGDTKEVHSQLQIAPTICKLLGIPIAETMKSPPIFVKNPADPVLYLP